MTSYVIEPDELSKLKGKTILIVGAASGIGLAAVEIALENGANVIMGDWNESAAAIAEKHPERTLYRRCDVSSWDDVLELFFEGWKRFGVIHSVLSNAGINSHEGLFQDSIDEKSGKLLPPNLKSIEVNLLGQIYVAKCALHFFRKWPDTPCQLAMTSSAGAYFAAPPIHLYCAAKAGVLGLMRAMYPEVAKTNVTVNVVAPWLTVTPMLIPEWLETWTLPKNSAEGVAKGLFLPVIRSPALNGKSFFVAGDKYIEFEDSLYRAQPEWMGAELCGHVREGQDILLGLK